MLEFSWYHEFYGANESGKNERMTCLTSQHEKFGARIFWAKFRAHHPTLLFVFVTLTSVYRQLDSYLDNEFLFE